MATSIREYSFLSPTQLFREVRGAVQLARQAVRSFSKEDQPPSSDQELAFFLPGLLAPGDLYWGVCRDLERRSKGRLRYHVPEIGRGFFNINCRPYWETVLCLEREYEALKPRVAVGHSLGGLQAIMLHAVHSDVSPCAIGSPIWGTPNRFVKGAARRFLGFDPDSLPEPLADLRAHVARSPRGITTISSKRDPVAPREQCVVENATNHESDGGHTEIVCHEKTLDLVARHNRRAVSPLRPVRTGTYASV